MIPSIVFQRKILGTSSNIFLIMNIYVGIKNNGINIEYIDFSAQPEHCRTKKRYKSLIACHQLC